MACTSSSSHNLHLLLLFLLGAAALLLPFISCDDDLIEIQCDFSTPHNLSDSFNTIISNIVKSPPRTGSVYSLSGSAYGLLWCGGEFSGSRCSACVTMVAEKLQENCPHNLIYARLLLQDFCYLRLENEDFIQKADGSFTRILINRTKGKVFRTSRNAFRISVDGLMDELKQIILRKNTRFGQREVDFDKNNSKIYGKGQCVRGLSKESCSYCLDQAKTYLMDHCMFYRSCEAFYGSCFLKYYNN